VIIEVTQIESIPRDSTRTISSKVNTDFDHCAQQNFLVWYGLQIFSHETACTKWSARILMLLKRTRRTVHRCTQRKRQNTAYGYSYCIPLFYFRLQLLFKDCLANIFRLMAIYPVRSLNPSNYWGQSGCVQYRKDDISCKLGIERNFEPCPALQLSLRVLVWVLINL